MKNCKKCNCEIESIPNWLFIQRLCRPCSRDIWNMNRGERKKNGTLKTMKMPQEYHSAYHKEWSKKNKDKTIQYARNARLAEPHKAKARDLLNKAVKSDKIQKKPCVVCGNNISEAHHEDYNKPFKVIWYCRKHHKQIHKKAT